MTEEDALYTMMYVFFTAEVHGLTLHELSNFAVKRPEIKNISDFCAALEGQFALDAIVEAP